MTGLPILFLRDLVDKGARPNPSPLFADLRNPGAGGATTIAANIVVLATAAADLPYVAYLLFALDVAAVAACVWVIVRKRPVAAPQEADSGSLQYEWGQGARWVARIALVALLACTTLIAWQLCPNRISGWQSLRGSLCLGPGETPVSGAAVDALSKVDSSVAVAEGETDDYGYFFVDLKPWARRPQHLLVTTKECGPIRLDVERPVRARSLCAPVPEPALPEADRGPVWRVSCPQRDRLP